MKAGQSKFNVGDKVKITGFTGNDAIYNGLEGEVTHPFATGCTDKGWIGLRLEEYTVYGYQINAHQGEVEKIEADITA